MLTAHVVLAGHMVLTAPPHFRLLNSFKIYLKINCLHFPKISNSCSSHRCYGWRKGEAKVCVILENFSLLECLGTEVF